MKTRGICAETMTCPFQYQVFLNKKRSYRELPMRLAETSTLFRNEDSGEMHGLIRVRQFTLAEGHLIIRPDQLEEEFKGCLELAKYMLETLGLEEDCSYRFSQWDPARTDKYEGTPEQWDEAQTIMGNLLDKLGIPYKIGIDEAAFYGPKLDIQDQKRPRQGGYADHAAIDMLLAKKFGYGYTDRDGTPATPYIIHRSSLGCYERTLALLLEKYAAHCRCGWRPRRFGFCRSGITSLMPPRRLPTAALLSAFGLKWTAAMKRSDIKSARPNCRKSHICL